MQEISDWYGVESEVYPPNRWLLIPVGTAFLLISVAGFTSVHNAALDGRGWIPRLFFAVFALFGAAIWAWALRSIIAPALIRHAPRDILPNVPQEPVIVEGSTVHGRLTHELVEDSDGWQFRPAQRLWSNDRNWILGFGIPFLTFFAGLLSWFLHTQHRLAWPLAILCGVLATVVCGGTTFVLIGMLFRAGYRRLCILSIPRNGDDLELNSPEAVDASKGDLGVGLKWMFEGPTGRQHLTLSRELLRAVQLCPWKFVVGASGDKSTTWAVQGLLVLECSEKDAYHRLPVLLTSDFAGAAKLKQRLASTLQVPFLFCADAEGWNAEAIRARNRQPLRSGGTMS